MPSYEVLHSLIIDGTGEHRRRGDLVDGAAFGDFLPRFIEIGAVRELPADTASPVVADDPPADTAPLPKTGKKK